MNGQLTDIEEQALPQVGNPLLGQIHEFIEADQAEQPSLDPVGIVIRAVRGRLIRSAALAFVVALLLGLVAWAVVPPVYQSLGMIRVMPKEAKILYADSDDSRLRLYDAFVTAEMQFLQSRPVLDHAVHLLDGQRERLPELPEDVSQVAGMLDVSNKKGLVSVAARSGNPLIAAAVVNAPVIIPGPDRMSACCIADILSGSMARRSLYREIMWIA